MSVYYHPEDFTMPSLAVAVEVAGILILLIQLLRYVASRRSLKYLRGPPSPSKLLGNEMEVSRQDQVGDLDFEWIKKYGNVWRTSGCLGKAYLMTVDPKALQHIFHTSGYNYPKSIESTHTMRILTDRGISWANGDVHQRQRKVMNPAFSAPQLRSYLPIIQHYGSKLSQKWKDQIQATSTGEQEINVAHWLSRAALDITGETSFDYHFGAMENAGGELLQCFDNLFADSMLYPPAWDFLFRFSWAYIPSGLLYYAKYLPTREYRRFRHFVDTAKRIGKSFLIDKAPEKNGKDVMSVLVKSNLSEDPARRLDEDEVLSQMANLILAGYETAASSLSWLLWELSKRPDQQNKIRSEIAAARADLNARRGGDFSATDYEKMTFMNNVIKEALRLHPIVPFLTRVADRDDIIPLSTPTLSKSEKPIGEIPINKGQEIIISICGYNRLESVWGEDAERWNPDRWGDTASQDRQTAVGTYANLMTFSAGVRGCIGWRLALLEMQAILVEMLECFEFSLPPDIEIQRVPTKIMIPMVRGRMHEGSQLPLRIKLTH